MTKGFGPDAVAAAAAAGCRAIGENYAQELATKAAHAAAAGLAVHFIGRLQSNKVRLLAGHVDVYETIDRPSLVREVAKRAPGATVLVQVNATGEAGKGGCPPADVAGLVEACIAAGLSVDGLMTVGPTVGGPDAARPAFRAVRRDGRRPRSADVLDGDDRRPRGRRARGVDSRSHRHGAVRPTGLNTGASASAVLLTC